jgi:hypothetical protein
VPDPNNAIGKLILRQVALVSMTNDIRDLQTFENAWLARKVPVRE